MKAYLVLLLVLPQQYVIGAVGFVGSPANIWGLGCMCAWGWYHLNRTSPIHESGTVRASLVLLGAILTSYIVAMRTPMTSSEVSLADGSIVRLVSWLGVLLIAVDGIPDLPAWRRVITWLCALSTALAGLAVFQLITGEAWIDRLDIPGLELNSSVLLSGSRNGMVRASATSTHAIEFGQLMAMSAVLAAAIALATKTRGAALMAVVCGLGVFLVVSRSSMLSIAAAMLVLVPALSGKQRLGAVFGALFVAATVFMAQPGLLGTLGSAFTGVAGDPSALSRTSSYDFALGLVSQRPLLGRGLGTLLPEYRILDNQWLVLMVEIGIVGISALIILFVTVLRTGRASEMRLAGSAERVIVRGCSAAVIGGCVGMLFFDSFAFAQAAGLLLLVCGLTSASGRLTAMSPQTQLPRRADRS